jgi:DNA (cytosine-5)-methyltransferase 1
VYAALRSRPGFLTAAQIVAATAAGAAGRRRGSLTTRAVLRGLQDLSQDFEVDTGEIAGEPAYRLGAFKAFLGQHDHERHQRFLAGRGRIS